MTTDRIIPIRLSPSGPVIGAPPSLVGNSARVSREWGKTGAGLLTNVPGTAAGDALGLESVVTDLKPATTGYQYDVYLSTNVFGANEGNGRFWKMFILGSTDTGSTFPVAMYTQPADYNQEGAGLIRHFTFANPNAANINRVKVQLQRAVAASTSMQYDPAETTIVITEISPTS